MNLPAQQSLWLRTVVFASALLLSGCVTLQDSPPTEPVYANAAERAEAQKAVLFQAWQLVNKRFYDPAFNGTDWATAYDRYKEQAATASDVESLYEVINEMLGELDDGHTGAMTPMDAWEDRVEERAFVGLNLERLEDEWVVTELRPGSAAQESEIEPGWIAIARDGDLLPDERLDLESTPGSAYTWTFLDERDRERDVTLEARLLPDWMPPQEWHSEEGWVYLRFDEFEASYHKWLRDKLRTHRDAPGIVLDLRQNGGGAVSSLEYVINDFFPNRVPYGAFISRKGKVDEEKSAWRDGVGYDGPVVALIGPSSASSAEILAHVFKHYDRATLIGRPTAGVVIASRYYRLRDGGELQIGMHDFKALDGTRLEGVGVEPDVEVERSLEDLREGYDADVSAAVKWLRANAEVAESAKL